MFALLWEKNNNPTTLPVHIYSDSLSTTTLQQHKTHILLLHKIKEITKTLNVKITITCIKAHAEEQHNELEDQLEKAATKLGEPTTLPYPQSWSRNI